MSLCTFQSGPCQGVRAGAIVENVTPPASLGTDATRGRLGACTRNRTHGGEPCVTFTLAATPSSVARARRLTRDRLSSLTVGDDACDIAALVVSELVTNAIVHTGSRTVVCEICTGADTVRIAVRDEGHGAGVPRPAGPRGPDEEHGRGLLLVSAVSSAWGVQDFGSGLSVWAELPRSPDPAACSFGREEFCVDGVDGFDGVAGFDAIDGIDGFDSAALG
ncbi:ATP-binding protein [Streptomyces sp. NPDC017940]|uniref:ATP-binding protein n=1 Tax=Streptomyces sp. NPDC017940 TaxID=3365017 RepID=UPI00378D6748